MNKIWISLLLCSAVILSSCAPSKPQETEVTSKPFETEVEPVPEYQWVVEADDTTTQNIADGISVEYHLQLNVTKVDGTTSDGAYVGSFQIDYAVDAGSYAPALVLVGLKQSDLKGYAQNSAAQFRLVPFDKEQLDAFAKANGVSDPYSNNTNGYMAMQYGTELSFDNSDLGFLENESVMTKLNTMGLLQNGLDRFVELFHKDRMNIPFLLLLHSDGTVTFTLFINSERISFDGIWQKALL